MKVTRSKANCRECGQPLRKVVLEEFDETYYVCVNVRCFQYDKKDERPHCNECGDVLETVGDEQTDEIYYICENKDCPEYGQ